MPLSGFVKPPAWLTVMICDADKVSRARRPLQGGTPGKNCEHAALRGVVQGFNTVFFLLSKKRDLQAARLKVYPVSVSRGIEVSISTGHGRAFGCA